MKFLTFEYDFDKYNITVKNYDQLIKELKLLNIKPQEAFDLAFKNKFQFNARYYWTMERIGMYLNIRYYSLIRNIVNIKKKKYKNYSFIYSKSEKNLPIIKKKAISLMPTKIHSCRNVVNFNRYKSAFIRYYPKEKFDVRKEAQNLHKLVTERRHRKKLISNKWYSLTKNNLYPVGFARFVSLLEHAGSINKKKLTTNLYTELEKKNELLGDKIQIPVSLIKEFEQLQ